MLRVSRNGQTRNEAGSRANFASAHDVVTVPVSALHKGRGRAGGRTGFWTPNQKQGSAALLSQSTGGAHSRFTAIRAAMKTPGAKRYFAMVANPDGSLERRPVAIGVMSRVSAQVLAGLNVGDKVVVGIRSDVKRASRNGAGAGNRSYGGSPRLGGYR